MARYDSSVKYDILVAQKTFGPNVSVKRIYVIKNSEKTKDRWIICGNNWNFFSDLKISSRPVGLFLFRKNTDM